MAPRPGDKLTQVWLDPEFADSVAALADAAGLSKSELIRQSLTRAALDLAQRGPARVEQAPPEGREGVQTP
jgi:hypothetical protein